MGVLLSCSEHMVELGYKISMAQAKRQASSNFTAHDTDTDTLSVRPIGLVV